MSIADPNTSNVVVWRFSDGRRGHDNQSLGLIEALSSLLPLEVHTVELADCSVGMLEFLRRRYPATDRLPPPHLIVGAGHGTHWPMLAARRARGGKIVVLMKPSLPRGWFDLCIIPKHDSVIEAANVLLTEGAINRVRPSGAADVTRGLILVGGASSHYDWDDAAVLSQIRSVIESDKNIDWVIADSPRTPPSFAARAKELFNAGGHASYVHHDEADSNWLPARLSEAGTIWVSEDSVSMLYEALSTGANVGVMRLHIKHDSRIAAGVNALVDGGRCLSVEDWKQGQRRSKNISPLREAERCATWIAQRWFSSQSAAAAGTSSSS